MLKSINKKLELAIVSGDKVNIRRAARMLELYLSSAAMSSIDPEQLIEAGRLGREADSVLKGIDPRFQHHGMKFGIGQRPKFGPTPDQRLKAALVDAKKQALLSSRDQARVRVEKIPKIIHCTWSGGGSIANVKSLDGIRSWLEETDYRVFVWWDSRRLFNMHVRKLLKDPTVRALYDDSATEDSLNIRGQVIPGSNRHNHRFLAQEMEGNTKFEMTKELWDEVEHDLEPLRALEEEYPTSFLLCDIRSKSLNGRINWLNLEHYERELTRRGMFAAAASDILRYEVVYNFGGVYIDVDIELTGGLGELSAHPDAVLAGITPDRNGDRTAYSWVGRDLIATTADYTGKCLYISNCIVAACPESRGMHAIRETVGLAYACLDKQHSSLSLQLDREQRIRRFWNADITRSTLDLTGPNVVREVLFQMFSGTPMDDIPRTCLLRLTRALAHHSAKIPKDIREAFSRVAYVWRDDDASHTKFWQWVSGLAVFPMANVKCDTDAAENSDCRTASRQRAPQRQGQPRLERLNPYFPSVPVRGTIDGLIGRLHERHNGKAFDMTQFNLEVNQVIFWAHAHWRVIKIRKASKKGQPWDPDKWRIELQRMA